MHLEPFFQKINENIILDWIKSLHIFRLCAMYPNPNDMNPERFLAKISFTTENEMLEILGKMVLREDHSHEEDSRFREYNESSASGWILINGNVCYLEINRILKTILIQVSGTKSDPFKFDRSVFRRAQTIERFLNTVNFHFIDPPQDDDYCICPKYYPNFF